MNTNNLDNMIITQAELNKMENDIIDVFRPLFETEGEFDYKKFEPYSSWRDGDILTVEEFPGWSFTTTESEEGGGHYAYHVCGFSPSNDPRDSQARPSFMVELYWD